MRSDHHAGRTWGKKGETPIVEATGARHGMSLISAITSRGHMRFMLIEKGGVNADVFIEFLKRLAIGAKRAIFLIVDRGPAHIAKKTKAFVESLNGTLRLFYLPPYSPDRNPDELVWKHLKADTVGRMTVTSKDDSKARSARQCGSCKITQPKSAPSTKNHLSDMPRERRDTYERINMQTPRQVHAPQL
jgi:transposase